MDAYDYDQDFTPNERKVRFHQDQSPGFITREK